MPILPPTPEQQAQGAQGAVSATILYRELDANGDPMWGTGKNDFLIDINAVAQAVLTRLRLFEGEWWEDQTQGLPLWQKMLGVGGSGRNLPAINLLITQVILGTPYVTSISNVQSSYNSTTRAFQFSAVITTQFGQIAVSNMPTPPSQAFPGVM